MAAAGQDPTAVDSDARSILGFRIGMRYPRQLHPLRQQKANLLPFSTASSLAIVSLYQLAGGLNTPQPPSPEPRRLRRGLRVEMEALGGKDVARLLRWAILARSRRAGVCSVPSQQTVQRHRRGGSSPNGSLVVCPAIIRTRRTQPRRLRRLP